MLCQLQGSTGTLPFAGFDWQTDYILVPLEPCHWQGCHLRGYTGKVVISYARQCMPLARLQWILDTPCNYASGISWWPGCTQSNDESQYSHCGGQLTGTVALVDDADLFPTIIPPALTEDGTKDYDGKHLQTPLSPCQGRCWAGE